MGINFTAILALISAVFVFGLGFFVFFKNRKSIINEIFVLMSLAVAVWLFGTFEMLRAATDEQAIFWDRFIYAGVVFVPALMYHFSLIFTKTKIPKKLLALSYIFSVIFLFISRTNYFVSDVFRYTWGVHTQARLFHHIFLIDFFFFLFLTLKNFYRYYINKALTGLEKTQAKYVFLAFLILITVGSTAYAPAYKIGIYPFSFGSGVVFVAILAYAIIVHRLMDIKIVLRRSTVYLASVLTVALPAGLILYFADRFYPELTVTTGLAALILGVSVFPAIRNYFYRVANRYFFSSLYDSGKVIRSLTDKLRSTLETQKIYDFIAQTLKGTFHCRAIGILTYDEKNNEYIIQYNEDFDIDLQKIFPTDRWLQEKFAAKGEILVVEEIEKETGGASASTFELLKRLGAEILAPLNVKDKIIGLIVLGGKESRDMYNSEDLGVLETVGGQAAISIENALLYEESRNFANTLKQEVEKATAELRTANLELQKLDKAKSDFISIASHQLRTPLSTIKGFVSMILEGSYGRISRVVRDKLEKTYESTERLIRLVNDLLDLSHMEGGKMEYNFAKISFSVMVRSVVEELKVQADRKKLKLELVKLEKELWVRADEQKLRQVVMNLIDNAVKYTEKGSVEVSLRELSSPGEKESQIQMSVGDTGMGMRPEEIANLFQKFVRGPNAPRLHTEGAGIGLYVAKQLIEAHQGRIWAESEGEGKGSMFFIKLPEWKD